MKTGARLSFKVPWSEVECISTADEEECLALARAEFRRQARLRAGVERSDGRVTGVRPDDDGHVLVVIVGRGVTVLDAGMGARVPPVEP